jgi:hypothetical protein
MHNNNIDPEGVVHANAVNDPFRVDEVVMTCYPGHLR